MKWVDLYVRDMKRTEGKATVEDFILLFKYSPTVTNHTVQNPT